MRVSACVGCKRRIYFVGDSDWAELDIPALIPGSLHPVGPAESIEVTACLECLNDKTRHDRLLKSIGVES